MSSASVVVEIAGAEPSCPPRLRILYGSHFPLYGLPMGVERARVSWKINGTNHWLDRSKCLIRVIHGRGVGSRFSLEGYQLCKLTAVKLGGWRVGGGGN